MREDMAKVFVERPRIKPWNNRKGRRQVADDLPCREGMRRGHAWRGDRKQLNENLAPLARYLASQAGRPWDKVYAEIAAHLRVDSAVQQHVRDHIKDFVALTPRRDISGWRRALNDGLWWQRFYVDPRTGLLRRTADLPEEKARRRARRQRPMPKAKRVEVGPDLEYRLLNGIWFEVQLAPLPTPIYRAAREVVRRPLVPWIRDSRVFEAEMDVRRLASPPVWDVVTGNWIEVGPAIDSPQDWKMYRRIHPQGTYAVAKRTLSRKELRQARLVNEPINPRSPRSRHEAARESAR